MKLSSRFNPLIVLVLALVSTTLHSQVRPHHIFDNNMVLQREKPVQIWGWSAPGEMVKVEFNGQVKSSVATDQGEWHLFLDPMPASAEPKDLIVSAKNSSRVFTNVLVGDLWILGGQSNMEFDLSRIFHGDTEIASANFPEIRLLTVPKAAGREALKDFERINEYDSWNDRYDEKGYWFICSPERVKTFSGLGYIFGKRLYMASQIPIGLIDASRGGTTLESWISPDKLCAMPENKALLNQWQERVDTYDPDENLKTRISNWEKRSASRKKQGLETGPKPTKPSPSPALDHNFPGSSYNGMVAVIAGLSVKGAIFHHGYNNALSDARPGLYAVNFNALIADWRDSFSDESMPFGIIELSAGGTPQTLDNFESRMVDAAPYIREGQLQTFLNLEDVGFASAYDQQVNWYHPQKKVELGERIARWALSTQYGFDLSWEPAAVMGVEIMDETLLITFSQEVKTSDDRPIDGFAVADSSGRFYPAWASYFETGEFQRGKPVYDKKRLVVGCPLVPDPVAVRYAWARNPLGNLVNAKDRIIPIPLFRSDHWDYPEAPYGNQEFDAHRERLRTLGQQAEAQTRNRIIRETH
ncbi:MAG: sialate O-acetylesterase [Bacteroidetes bacterium]|nr:sialate O-acetylesterase [Bacteroidota bacterium]